MLLLAVSGGPDSMFMLNEYKNKKIVVAHVNYNIRENSKNDENIVREFCAQNNIKLKVLNVQKKSIGNFEMWARDIRYKWFKKLYDQYEVKTLLVGHHRDDFLETALMQQQSGRTPRYFGIRFKNNIYGMIVKRPFINLYWKQEIEDELKSKNINFAIDETNYNIALTRNKIRNELSNLSIKEKMQRVQWFRMSNKILIKKFKRIDREFLKWKKYDFLQNVFVNFKNKEEVIFIFINELSEKISISKGKLENIVKFVESKDGGKLFKLNADISLIKKHGKVNVEKK